MMVARAVAAVMEAAEVGEVTAAAAVTGATEAGEVTAAPVAMEAVAVMVGTVAMAARPDRPVLPARLVPQVNGLPDGRVPDACAQRGSRPSSDEVSCDAPSSAAMNRMNHLTLAGATA